MDSSLMTTERNQNPDSLHGPERMPGQLSYCIFLMYFFSLCDCFLKFLPFSIATPMRYIPEALLYLWAVVHVLRRGKLVSMPLFWPFLACVGTMAVSTFLNGISPTLMAQNLYTNFRMLAFAALLWGVQPSPSQLRRFFDHFLRLVAIEAVIGLCQLVFGGSAKSFFAPNLDWSSSSVSLPLELHEADAGYLLGTLSNYNHYGMFMSMGLLISLLMYSQTNRKGYQWMAIVSGLCALLSFSRHTLILMAIVFVVNMLWNLRPGAVFVYVKRASALLLLTCIVFAASKPLQEVFAQRFRSLAQAEVLNGDPQQNIRMFMIVYLVPRILASTPVIGQGPLEWPRGAGGSSVASLGPQLKAAPQLPGWVTHYLNDVVWIAFFSAYGLLGLLGLCILYGTIYHHALRLNEIFLDPEYIALARFVMGSMCLFALAGFFSQEVVARDTVPVLWCSAGMMLSLYSVASGKRLEQSPISLSTRSSS